MTLGAVAFVVIMRNLGGVQAAMQQVAQTKPELLVRSGNINAWKFLSYTLIPLSVGMFPHIFMHWLSAKKVASFRYTILFYPLCVAIVWVPSVLLGVAGSVAVPGLNGPAANSVLVKMIEFYSPEMLAGLLAAGIFAAVMSSLDSQVLAIGTMFTNDIIRHYRFHDRMSEKQQVLVGRAFVVLIIATTYVLALVFDRSIFKLGIWSFTGFAALLPVVVAALFWKRSTKYGVFAAVLGVTILWLFFFFKGWQNPGYTLGGTGIMPVAALLAVSTAAMIVGSLLSPAPKPNLIERFFPDNELGMTATP